MKIPSDCPLIDPEIIDKVIGYYVQSYPHLDFGSNLHTRNNCAIRMNISPSLRKIKLPDNYKLTVGKGVIIRGGSDAIIFAYGPVMLNEALIASEILAMGGFGLEVVNMPWLNRIDRKWLKNIIHQHVKIFVLEDHAPVGGLGDFLLRQMIEYNMLDLKQFKIFSVEGLPACGTPSEALQYHGLNGGSLAKNIKSFVYEKQSSIQ